VAAVLDAVAVVVAELELVAVAAAVVALVLVDAENDAEDQWRQEDPSLFRKQWLCPVLYENEK
jgi:hypothetical protein